VNPLAAAAASCMRHRPAPWPLEPGSYRAGKGSASLHFACEFRSGDARTKSFPPLLLEQRRENALTSSRCRSCGTLARQRQSF
jgi:hypothetical protein